jgi:hypothetical protein
MGDTQAVMLVIYSLIIDAYKLHELQMLPHKYSTPSHLFVRYHQLRKHSLTLSILLTDYLTDHTGHIRIEMLVKRLLAAKGPVAIIALVYRSVGW